MYMYDIVTVQCVTRFADVRMLENVIRLGQFEDPGLCGQAGCSMISMIGAKLLKKTVPGSFCIIENE